jgi:hypothetical protein
MLSDGRRVFYSKVSQQYSGPAVTFCFSNRRGFVILEGMLSISFFFNCGDFPQRLASRTETPTDVKVDV